MKTLYDDLGIDINANDAEIKNAYRKKARENHPDKGGDVEKFKIIQNAYSILKDSSRRKKYDETGDYSKSDINSVASNTLSSIFLNIVENYNGGNIIDKAKNIINKGIKENKNLQQKISIKIEKFEKFLNRVDSANSVNLYKATINQKIMQLKNEKHKIDELINIGNTMLEIISSYSDNSPEQTTISSPYSAFTIFTS